MTLRIFLHMDITFEAAVKYAGSQAKLARMLGVTDAAIHNIKARGSWSKSHSDLVRKKLKENLVADFRRCIERQTDIVEQLAGVDDEA